MDGCQNQKTPHEVTFTSDPVINKVAPLSLSVLIIEDDASDYSLVEAEFQRIRVEDNGKFDLTWAKTLSEGLVAARKALPDVVLLDLSLPDSFGLSTLKSLTAVLSDLPVVVFTSTDDDNLAILALESGAQDCLIKGQFDRYALKRALRNASVRKQMEQNLLLFKSALNSAADGVEITDSAGRIEWANTAFMQITGYTLDEVVGRTPGELVKSGVHDVIFYQQMWETILAGKVWRGEVVNRRKDGSRYDELLSIAPVFDANGLIRHFVSIKKNITDRKSIEQHLAQNEQRLELALATSELGIWDLDINSGLAVTNARWHEILGYAAADNIKLDEWEKLIHPDDRIATRAKLNAYVKGDTPSLEYEYRIRHKNGHWVWILLRGKTVSRDTDGNPLRIIGTNLDISYQQRIRHDGADLLQRIATLIQGVGEFPGKHTLDDVWSEIKVVPPQLSDRQIQVLKLVASGCTSTEIATQLNIKPATVVTHRRDLMAKLDLHNVAELTRYAITHGLISGK